MKTKTTRAPKKEYTTPRMYKSTNDLLSELVVKLGKDKIIIMDEIVKKCHKKVCKSYPQG